MPHTQLSEPPPYSPIALSTEGAGGAASAGMAPMLNIWIPEEALGTGLAAQPHVALEARALPRGAVAFHAGTAHGAAVAQVSCKGKEKLKPM